MSNLISHEQVPMPSFQPNELNERLIGMPALSPFFRHVSGPRAAMFNKHISQRPTPFKTTSQRLQTGVGVELGKYTYSIKIPKESYIIKIVPKYAKSLSYNGEFVNPLTSVIYENSATNEIDIVDFKRFHSEHQYFGFEYKYDMNALGLIREDSRISNELKVADSPAVSPDGDYRFGVHANMALCSDPVVIEDGIKISESFAKSLEFPLFETRILELNTSSVALNLYGDKDHYKIFPNIGDKVRLDGAVFGIRDIENGLAPVDMSVKALQRIDIYDTCVFGRPGAEVIDVEVIKGDTSRNNLPIEMTDQLTFHYDNQLKYYKTIYTEYRRLKREHKDALRLSKRFKNRIREAHAVLNSDTNKLSYRSKDKIVGWRIKVTYKYTLIPKDGYKLSDLMGGKGVVCAVVPDEKMPINEIGIRADMVMDNQSPYKRTIMAKYHEIYINACLDMTLHNLKNNTDINDPTSLDKGYEYMLGFYKIVSPKMYTAMLENNVNGRHHVIELLKGNIGLWVPSDNPVDYMEVIDLLTIHYPPCLGKVQYVGNKGDLRTTKADILIGGCYTILLDKIATENAAVASAKTQHFGVPSKLSKSNKYHSPLRNQPTKTIAEDESRTLESVVGGEITADLLDQTNNPEVHKSVLRSIYATDTPSNIDTVVNRSLQPTGHGYIQNMVNNALSCVGIKFVPAPKGVD